MTEPRLDQEDRVRLMTLLRSKTTTNNSVFTHEELHSLLDGLKDLGDLHVQLLAKQDVVRLLRVDLARMEVEKFRAINNYVGVAMDRASARLKAAEAESRGR